jgi:molybdopterin-binding protein
MPKELYTASEAARALGISLDTLRRWDKQGRIATSRDEANRRVVTAAEIERLAGAAPTHERLSARNRFHGVIRDLRVEGLLAQVEIEVTEPARIVAVITREAASELGLGLGMRATGVVKATSVMVER